MQNRRSRKSGSGTKNAQKIDNGLRPGGAINPWLYFSHAQQIILPKVLLDSGLTDEHILTFGLLRLHGGRDRCIPSHKTLGREIGVSTTTARRSVGALRKQSFIKTIARGNPDGSRTTDEYQPVWNAFWKQAAANRGSLSTLQIGDVFKWSDLAKQRWPSYFIPLKVAARCSPGTSLLFGLLRSRLHERLGSGNRGATGMFDTQCSARIRELAGILHRSRDRVMEYLNELVRQGFLVRKAQFRNDGKQVANIYVFINPDVSQRSDESDS